MIVEVVFLYSFIKQSWNLHVGHLCAPYKFDHFLPAYICESTWDKGYSLHPLVSRKLYLKMLPEYVEQMNVVLKVLSDYAFFFYFLVIFFLSFIRSPLFLCLSSFFCL